MPVDLLILHPPDHKATAEGPTNGPAAEASSEHLFGGGYHTDDDADPDRNTLSL